MKRLMVIIRDELSTLVSKGEVVPRYYNPCDIADEVHIVLLNDDHPDPAAVQPMVGRARLVLHNYPAAGRLFFAMTLGWRPRLLRLWGRDFVKMVDGIRPDLIRCHGNDLNAFLAYEAKRKLGIPYVVSLHGNPDVDYFRGRLGRTRLLRLKGKAIVAVENLTIRGADFVMPVYSPIVPYLRSRRVERYEIVYNAVGHSCRPKDDYTIDRSHVRALCVGRQESLQKDPTPILQAMVDIPELHLTLIGTGDLHDSLKETATRLGLEGRTTFVERMENAKVLELLSESDLYVYSSINYEISKTCMEAALTGLPVILNDRDGQPAEELMGGHFLLVSNTREGYVVGLRRLIDDDDLRADLGRRARSVAESLWTPEPNERHAAEIYQRVVAGSPRPGTSIVSPSTVRVPPQKRPE